MTKRPSPAALEKRIKALEEELVNLKSTEEALRKSEEKYRTLFDNAADVIAVMDPEGTLLDLNARFEDECGYKREDMIGKNIFECGIMTEPSARNLRSRLKGLLDGEPWEIQEIQCIRKNGEIVPHELNVVPMEKEGLVFTFEAVWWSISDRKRAEEALRRENERFQLLVEASPLAVSIIDKEGRYKYINPKFTKVFGYTLKDIPTGREWFRKAYPDEKKRKEVIANWFQDLKSAKKGEIRARTFPTRCKDGSQKIITFRSVSHDKGDQFVIYEDASERTLAMDMLRESQERYRSVFENTGTAMGIYDEEMTILMANSELEELTGYAKEELEGKLKWTQFVSEEDRERMIGYHQQRTSQEANPPTEYEFRLVDRKGEKKDVFLKIAMLPGTLMRIASMVDITALREAQDALQRSEEKYRSILGSIEEGYFEVDLPGNLTFFNDALCRIAGYTREQLTGMNNREYVPPESAKRMYEVFNRVYQTGIPEKATDYEIIRGDGSHCILALSTSLMRDSSGNPVGFRGVVRDITDRKLAEKALKESEEKYRQLMNHAPAGIYELDFKEQKFVTVNDVMCEYTGYSKEEFLTLSPLDILTEDSKRRFLERMSKAFSGEKVPETVEFEIKGKGGRNFWVLLNARYIYEKGLPKGATVVVYDITERKLAEEALRKSEETYRLLVDNANDGIFIAQDGRIKFPNPKTIEVLGYAAEELAHVQYRDLIHPEDWPLFVDRQKRGPNGKGTTRTYSLRVINKNGEEIWAQINAVPLTWEGRAATLNFVRDITPQKKLEAQLLQAQKMEAIGTIAGGVAHNFRNILAVISMKSQLIQMKYKDYPALEEVAGGIDTYIERGVQLVEGLMQFCRKESAKKLQPVNLSEILHETYQLISKSFDKMIEIHLDLPHSLPVVGDEAALSQVFMNLCTNARDAMPRGGQLRIEGRVEGNRVVVLLTDTGEGMDQKTLEKCFDPFFTTKEPDKGTGLGLSTTYGIVKEHKGEIQVDSDVGQGSCFRLHFPLAPLPEDNAKDASPQIVRGGGQKILIVDDEIDICRLMKELLAEYGYHVAYVTSGKAAVTEYKTWQPDIMLLDRNMPEMDGLSVAEEIMDYDPEAKIVVISGYDENGPLGIEEEKKRLIKGYLSKPINIKELSTLLTRMI